MVRTRYKLFEALEERRLLASDWNNVQLVRDVDRSGLVTPQDAMLVIDDLNNMGARRLPPRGLDSLEPLVDVNADQWVTPLDVLLVIDAINSLSDRQPLITGGLSGVSDPNGNGVVLVDNVTITGQTLPDSLIEISVDGRPSTAVTDSRSGVDGKFMVDLPVTEGRQVIRITAVDLLGRKIQLNVEARRGNTIHDWSASVLTIVRQWTALSNDPYTNRIVPSQPPLVARNLAMIHTAMFNAANAVQREFPSYKMDLIPEEGIDASVAAAAAGFEVAKSLYSAIDEVAVWQATLDESLAQSPEGSQRTASLNFGRLVGQAMLAERANDGAKGPSTYTAGSDIGRWQRTFPDYLPPLLPQWPGVKPFLLSSGIEFLPPAPPALSSEQYARDVDEVMRLGSFDSSERTAEQTEIAVFWADGGGTFTPPGHWNQIAADVTLAQSTSLVGTSRAFALLNLAIADAGIVSWNAKYTYDLWRPIDAIRSADLDGNPATEARTNWIPLIKTPPFPTYTSGHSTFSGAASAVLTSLFGAVAFDSSIDAQGGPEQRPLNDLQLVTRHFESFDQAAEEAGASRIYGGIHFTFDNIAGLESGRRIGAATIARMSMVPASTQ